MTLKTFIYNLAAMWAGEDATISEAITREENTLLRRQYRKGIHKPTMKTKEGHPNDNVTVNLIKLVTARAVALLVGQGFGWTLPGGTTDADGKTTPPPAQAWLDLCWKLNKKSILLHNACTNASDAGCGFLRIRPAEIERDGVLYPRLIAIDPNIVTEIRTDPDDKDHLTGYTIIYAVPEGGKQKGIKQEILFFPAPVNSDTGEKGGPDEWWIIDYEEQRGRWVEVNRELFADSAGTPYPFPPMIHWQNLPEPTSAWGEPDATADTIQLQDKINYAYSNVGKILRLCAHPSRFGIDVKKPDDEMDWGPDNFPLFKSSGSGTTPTVGQLAAVGDLPGAVKYISQMTQALFDTTRTVDLNSLADKLGALTNFALRVLYFDALQKLDTKREVFGEMVLDLNTRLLLLGGQDPDPGTLNWPANVLPVNDKEEVETLQMEMDAGLISQADAIKARGRDPITTQQKIAEEKKAAALEKDANNIGAFFLANKNFSLNGGGGQGE